MTAARKPATSESWDAFWTELETARTEVICGVEVPVPTDLPLSYERRLDELRDLGEGADPEEFEPLVEPLFGPGVLAQWVENGIGVTGLLVAVTWGMMQARGQDITFREAYEIVVSDDEGKALGGNRAQRRAAAKTAAKKTPRSSGRSASTGGRSKPTSSASTGSARKISRA